MTRTTLVAANIVRLLGSLVASQLEVRLERLSPIFAGGHSTLDGLCCFDSLRGGSMLPWVAHLMSSVPGAAVPFAAMRDTSAGPL